MSNRYHKIKVGLSGSFIISMRRPQAELSSVLLVCGDLLGKLKL